MTEVDDSDQVGSSSSPLDPEVAPSVKSPRPLRPKIVVTGAAFAIGLALGVLNAAGIAAGLVITVLSVLSLLTASALALWELVRGELQGYTRRAQVIFIAAVVGLAVLLIGVGIVLRPGPDLPRMPGTTDVALIGLEAAESEDQDVLDDVASSLEKSLVTNLDGQVKSYAELVEPPLEQLTLPAGQRSDLDRWVAKFLKDTDAELLIAGYEEEGAGPGVQRVLHVFAFVPFAVSADAPELSGWFGLTDYLVDRDLRGSRARNDLVADISAHLADLSNFLDGLDAWHNGEAADATAALGPMLQRPQADRPNLLYELALLYRGHAYETRAQVTDASDRSRLLEFAQHDYEAVPVGSTIIDRARLSLAVNAYLKTATSGCGPAADRSRLRTTASNLADVATSATDPRVALKARANQAQVTYCLSRAGDSAATAELEPLLEPLLRLPLTPDDPDLRIKQQIKALAISIDALRTANANRLPEAVARISEAIELEQGRLERQAQWLSLQSSWLLRLCRIAEGESAQQRSLEGFVSAARRNRIPQSKVDAYRAAFVQDLTSARRRCAESTSGPR